MKKRLFTLGLALALCLGLTVPAFAYDTGMVGRNNVISAMQQYAYIAPDNSLWMWGSNGPGYLGVALPNNAEQQKTPIKVMDNVASVSVGIGFTGAIKTDGSLWMWGSNGYGEIGNGGSSNASTDSGEPVQSVPVKVMDDVAAVSCGFTHAAAIKTDGSLWIWGDNQAYQLGNGGVGNAKKYELVYQTVPVKIMDDVSAVSCGWFVTAAVKTDGSLWMWGSTKGYMLGREDAGNFTDPSPFRNDTYQTVPLKIMDNVTMVSCGDNHVAALKTDGTLWVWGANDVGQLGSIFAANKKVEHLGVFQTEPIRVAHNVAFVSAGSCTTGIIKTDGSLWMCGNNFYGQLGWSTDKNISSFLKNMDNIAAVCYGTSNNVMAVKTDGSLWQWGAGILATGENGNKYRNSLGGGRIYYLDSPIQIPGVTVKVNSGTPSVTVPSVSAVGGFTDVKSTDYFADAVLWAVEKNITSGTSATTFSPGTTCSKAQILTFLWRANGSPEPTAANPFTDIKPADYYYKAALWATEKGIVSGSTFGGGTDCTRAMTVEYLWKAAGSPTAAKQASFNDVPASADYTQAVAWAVEKGITSGTGGGNFSPAATCTRGQIVTFLHRAMGK